MMNYFFLYETFLQQKNMIMIFEKLRIFCSLLVKKYLKKKNFNFEKFLIIYKIQHCQVKK